MNTVHAFYCNCFSEIKKVIHAIRIKACCKFIEKNINVSKETKTVMENMVVKKIDGTKSTISSSKVYYWLHHTKKNYTYLCYFKQEQYYVYVTICYQIICNIWTGQDDCTIKSVIPVAQGMLYYKGQMEDCKNHAPFYNSMIREFLVLIPSHPELYHLKWGSLEKELLVCTSMYYIDRGKKPHLFAENNKTRTYLF